MLFGNKKEWSTDTHYSLEGPWKIYAKWKPEYAKDHVLYDSLYTKWPERGYQYSHTQAITPFPSRLLESSVWWVCPSVPLSCSHMFKLQFRLLSQGGTNIAPLPDFCVSSMAQPCLTLCDPMDCSTPGFLSITNSWILLKLMSLESVMPSNHLILCRPLLLLPSIFPSIRVFSNESVLCIRWPKYWGFCFSISPSNEYSGLISFRLDWFDLLAVQVTLRSLLQHHSSKLWSLLWSSTLWSLF